VGVVDDARDALRAKDAERRTAQRAAFEAGEELTGWGDDGGDGDGEEEMDEDELDDDGGNTTEVEDDD